jgi:hypothetical protein
MSTNITWMDKLSSILVARTTTPLTDTTNSGTVQTASGLAAGSSGTITVNSTAASTIRAGLVSSGAIYGNYASISANQVLNIPAQYSSNFIFPLPSDCIDLKRSIFPYREITVFKDPKENKYYFKRNWGYNGQKKETEMDIHHDTLTIADHYQDPMGGGKASGVQPEQLMIVTIDYLTNKEDKTPEEENSLKHLNYALAFMEKDILNKSKL